MRNIHEKKEDFFMLKNLLFDTQMSIHLKSENQT